MVAQPQFALGGPPVRGCGIALHTLFSLLHTLYNLLYTLLETVQKKAAFLS